MQHRMEILYRRYGTTYSPIFKGQAVLGLPEP